MKKINTITDIDCGYESGKLLLAAMAKITTESQRNKTPDDVLDQLHILKDKMSFDEYIHSNQNEIDFGQAIKALEHGFAIARTGWNGKGMFVVKQIPAEIGLDIIPKMQSLPETAKNRLIAEGMSIKYTNQMLIIHSDGRADSWVPSSSDVFAKDWVILSIQG